MWLIAKGLLAKVPIGVWVLLAALAWGAYQKHAATAAINTLRVAEQKAAAEREATLVKQIQDLRGIQSDFEKAANDANIKAARASAAAASSVAAGQRLRNELATLDKRACDGSSAAASPGSAASSPADLRAYVSRRLDEAADGIAGFAESAIGASQTCFESYSAVRKKR